MGNDSMKKLSKRERADLWYAVDNEGFGYYMLHYGPDLNAIERLGFDLKEVEAAIEVFRKVETAIHNLEGTFQ